MGWLGMRERVTALGGQLAIADAGVHGVRIDAHIPLQEAS
jgi:signal transduction histidine kinase